MYPSIKTVLVSLYIPLSIMMIAGSLSSCATEIADPEVSTRQTAEEQTRLDESDDAQPAAAAAAAAAARVELARRRLAREDFRQEPSKAGTLDGGKQHKISVSPVETVTEILPIPPPPPPASSSTSASALAFQTAELAETDPSEAIKTGSAAPDGEAVQASEQPDYIVRLSADERIPKPGTGQLRIWIGHNTQIPGVPEGMVADAVTLPNDVIGDSAEVTLHTPGFEREPQGVGCLDIHPSGDHILYTLTPLVEGTHKITAQVFLYDTPDCKGPARTKIPPSLKVTVEVNTERIVNEGLNSLAAIVWEKFLDFWEYAVALVFGLVLFLFRKALASLFGYEPDA